MTRDPDTQPATPMRARAASTCGALALPIGAAIVFGLELPHPAIAANLPDVAPIGSSSPAVPAAIASALESLRGVPRVVFFGALVVASWIPFPVTLFYLAAGILYGVPIALAWIAASLVVSNLVLHTVANRFLRPELERLVARRGYRTPSFDSPLDEALFITLIRLTPGIPYFLQNVVLTVARVELLRFVVLSVAIQMIYVTGFVVLGRSAFEGDLGFALGGVALLVALAVGMRFLSRRRARD